MFKRFRSPWKLMYRHPEHTAWGCLFSFKGGLNPINAVDPSSMVSRCKQLQNIIVTRTCKTELVDSQPALSKMSTDSCGCRHLYIVYTNSISLSSEQELTTAKELVSWSQKNGPHGMKSCYCERKWIRCPLVDQSGYRTSYGCITMPVPAPVGCYITYM